MKLCYRVQRDNTLMDFGLRLNLVLIFDSLCLVGSRVVIELNKITRIGMIPLNPEITKTIGFDMKINYKQTMISCRKELWFSVCTNRTYTVQRLTGGKLSCRSEMWDNCYTNKIMYYCINTGSTIFITLQFI